MLQCTQAAAATLREVRQTQGLPESYGIRVFGAPSPDGEVGLGIGFAERPAKGDHVGESAGTRLFVAPDVADNVADMALDVVPPPSNNGREQPKLVLRPAGDVGGDSAS
jgi:Fe-S cluster assembly iron-binding protein IscA